MVTMTDRHATELMTLALLVKECDRLMYDKRIEIVKIKSVFASSGFVVATIHNGLDSTRRGQVMRRVQRTVRDVLPKDFRVGSLEGRLCLISCIVHGFLQNGWRPERYPEPTREFLAELLECRNILRPLMSSNWTEDYAQGSVMAAKRERIFVV